MLGRWAARRAPERTPRVPSRSAGKGASPSRSPCAPSCLAGWTAAHAQTLDSAAAWCFDTPWADPRAGRDSGAARPRQAQGSQRTPKEGGFSPRPPAHPREGPPNIPLSLSRARGRRHPSCCGRVTPPGSPRPGGKDGSCRCSPQLLRVGISTGGGEKGEAPKAPRGGWAGRPAWEPAASPAARPHRIPMPASQAGGSHLPCTAASTARVVPGPPFLLLTTPRPGGTPKCWAQATSLCPDPGCVPGAAGSSAGFTSLGSRHRVTTPEASSFRVLRGTPLAAQLGTPSHRMDFKRGPPYRPNESQSSAASRARDQRAGDLWGRAHFGRHPRKRRLPWGPGEAGSQVPDAPWG